MPLLSTPIRLTLVLLIFGLLSSGTKVSEAATSQDYCKFRNRSIVIFVDRTTAYDDVDKKLFVTGFEKIFGAFKFGDKISVYTITGDYGQHAKTFERCIPGCPETGLLDWITATCRPLRARSDALRFKKDLARHIRSLLDDVQQYDHSDIARTIAQVTHSLQSEGVSGRKPRRLGSVFVFSDLIENSKLLPWPSIVRTSPKVALAKLGRNGVSPILAGARVFAFGFGRLHDQKRSPLGAANAQKVKAFWHAYFRNGGAKTVFIGPGLN